MKSTLKTTVLVAVCLLMVASVSFGQMKSMADKSGGTLPMGLGATVINGETWFLVNFAPEVAFGKFGMGLDLNLRISSAGKLRPGEYEKFADYLRIIRYVRWGQKGDEFYTRVGQLDYSLLGHGSIVYLYRNSASYDMRKTGVELDLNFEKFGMEMVYSDVAHAGLLGMRGYVKPLKFTSLASIPVINNLEVGATYATDLDDNANKTYGTSAGVISDKVMYQNDDGNLSIWGFDLGLPIIKYSMISSELYMDFAQIVGYGHGTTAGINLHLAPLSLLTLDAKYERRFNGDQYMPAYFNALYERDRYAIQSDTTKFLSKAQTLKSVVGADGYYGEIMLSILGTFKIIGGYQSPVGVKNQGLLHLETQLPEVAGLVARASLDKKNVGSVFKMDDNMLMQAEIGYKPYPFLLTSMVYQRTFAKNASGVFEKQDRVEPKVSFVFNF